MQTRVLPYVGLAALKIISRSLPDSLGGNALKREFAKKLVAMRGLPMKMSQVLSMSKDDAVAQLQKEALMDLVAAPHHEVLERMQGVAPELIGRIMHLSQDAIVASLGQVHKASMQDGRICALKIRHAGIGPAMDLDTGLMGFLISIFGQFKEGFAIDAYQKLLTQELRWELDYPYEIRRQSELYKVFADMAGIVIPNPYPQESGSEHLLMDWEASETVEKFAVSATEAERFAGTKLLAEFHFHSIFYAGMAHADPNPGNFGLRRGANGVQLVVYDYGSLVPLEVNMIQGFLSLVQAIRHGRDPISCLLEMGFLPAPLSAIQTKLKPLCEILLEPFIQEENFLLSDWNRGQRVKDLLGAERWNLMIAAPPSLFFIMRAFHGLFYYADILGGRVSVYDLMSRLLEKNIGHTRFMDVSKIDSNSNGAEIKSKLHVVFSKNGEIVVSLTLPGDSVNRLEQIMEPELLRNLHASGINVKDMSNIAKNNAYAAMSLFDWEGGGKRVKIFLA